MYQLTKQVAFSASLVAVPVEVRFNNETKQVTKALPNAEDGTYRAVKMSVAALNLELEAEEEGPEHGIKPQRRDIVILVDEETRTPLPGIFAEKAKIGKGDRVIRTYNKAAGGGQMARIALDKIENLQEAIDGAFEDDTEMELTDE